MYFIFVTVFNLNENKIQNLTIEILVGLGIRINNTKRKNW